MKNLYTSDLEKKIGSRQEMLTLYQKSNLLKDEVEEKVFARRIKIWRSVDRVVIDCPRITEQQLKDSTLGSLQTQTEFELYTGAFAGQLSY